MADRLAAPSAETNPAVAIGAPPPSEVRGLHSIYWRMLIGMTLLIAVLVVAQAGAVLWLINRGEQGSDRLSAVTQRAAAHVNESLGRDPSADVLRLLQEISPTDRLFAITIDGRVFGADPGGELAAQVASDLARTTGRELPRTWQRSPYRAAPILSSDRLVGLVGVMPPTTIERYGPALAIVTLIVMFGGAILGTAVIIGPLRARLRNLTAVARQLGSGDFTARAKQEGSDEVTELATAFNQLVDELAKRARRLRASDAARKQLLADVSHELKTPVTTIRGYLETLAMPEVQLDSQTRARHVAVARREIHRLERLIGDLLDAARLEAGADPMQTGEIPIPELFEGVVDRHEHECRSREIRLTSSVAPGAETVVGDAFRLEQALTNVTANALRHTPNGGHVELRAERNGDAVVMTVTDNGEGIAPEHLPLIFDRFYKTGSSAKGTPPGSGLGLYIVKTIIERHGGSVSAASTLGQGTTIRLALPQPERPVRELGGEAGRAIQNGPASQAGPTSQAGQAAGAVGSSSSAA